jgi:hypothetical protein
MNVKFFQHLTSPCLQLTAVQVLGGFVFVAFGSTLPTAAPFPFDGRRRPVALRRPIALTFRFIHPAERLPSSDFDCSEIIFVNCAAHQLFSVFECWHHFFTSFFKASLHGRGLVALLSIARPVYCIPAFAIARGCLSRGGSSIL